MGFIRSPKQSNGTVTGQNEEQTVGASEGLGEASRVMASPGVREAEPGADVFSEVSVLPAGPSASLGRNCPLGPLCWGPSPALCTKQRWPDRRCVNSARTSGPPTYFGLCSLWQFRALFANLVALFWYTYLASLGK